MPYGQDTIIAKPSGGYGNDAPAGATPPPGTDAGTAFMNGMIGGVPVAGPYLKRAGEWINKEAGQADPAAANDAIASAHPTANFAGTFAGNALPYAALGPLGAEGWAANMGASGALGAADGGVRAYNDGGNVVSGALGGGVGSAVGSGVASGIGSFVSPIAKGVASMFGKTGAPEFADAAGLTAARKAAYAPVDNSDLIAPMDKTKMLADSLRKASWGYDQSPISGITSAVDGMNTPDPGGLNKFTSLTTLDALRKIANKSNSDSAPALGNVINDFIKDPANFVGNDSHSDVIKSLMEGRKLSSQEAKLEAFSEPMDKSADIGARYGTSANRQGTAAMNLKYGDEPWSPDELAGLNRIQHPGMLAETLRHYGKLDPTGSNPMAWLEGGITPLVAMEGGIPMVATQAGILAGAAGARRVSDAMSKSAVSDTAGTILNRGVNPYGPNVVQKALTYTNPATKALTRSALSSGGSLADQALANQQ